jgi:branched-chain amino acid transport system substrate-binding protein
LVALGVALAIATPALAQDPPVRIGYAIARTGPWAAGAQVTQEPNYLLWAEQVNAAGGLSVQGKRRKVELIGYDDRSETETVVRTFEKLMAATRSTSSCRPGGRGRTSRSCRSSRSTGTPCSRPPPPGASSST